jgi:hypothetical protein
MKKIKTLITASFLLLAVAIVAQKSETKGYLALWGELGYAGINHDIKKFEGLPKVTTPFSGYGGGLGIGYEFHHNSFIAQIGVEGNYWNVGNPLKDLSLTGVMIDSEGDEFEAVYDLKDNSDRYQLGYLNVPLFVGFHLSKRTYFLVGAKYGLNVFGQANVKSETTDIAYYAQFIDPFKNMPNHDLQTIEKKRSHPVSFENNLAASLEFGVYLNPNYSQDRLYRLAIFADYGFLNIHKNAINQEGDVIQNLRQYPYFQPIVNPVLLSGQSYNRNFTPMFAGLKFTILFKLHENSICVCEW